MAWGARSGLKLIANTSTIDKVRWLNGLGSPFGIETDARFRASEIAVNG